MDNSNQTPPQEPINNIPTQAPSPVIEPQQTFVAPTSPPTKSKKLLIIFVIALLLIGAAVVAWFVFVKKDKQNNFTQQTTATGSVGSFSLDSIQNQEDLAALNEEEGKAFCAELLKYDAEGPEVKSLHDRLGFSGGLYENLYLGCTFSAVGDEYLKKDKTGENDEYYRRDAQKYKDIAKTFQFDIYDTTYKVDDLDLSKRVAIDISGEAETLLMEYSTLADGGFNPYSSRKVISINVFNVRDFPDLKINCGPNLMRLQTAHLHNNDSCVKTATTFQGVAIYKGEGISSASYNVTLNGTRIIVEARNEDEALAVIQSMKKVTYDKLDFFIKN